LSVKETDLPADQDLSRVKIRADKKRRAEEINCGMSRPFVQDPNPRQDLLVKTIIESNQKKEERQQWRRQTKERDFGRSKLEFRISFLRDLINDAHSRQDSTNAARLESELEDFLRKYDDFNGLGSP
jgi:hypothetical protein